MAYRRIIRIASLFLFTILLNSCYKDSEEALYPGILENPSCQTDQMSYVSNVVPVIDNNCNRCHGASNYKSLGSGILLEGYDSFMAWINNGKILDSIKQNGGAKAMPQGAGKLSDCDIAEIENWILQGANNN